MAGMCPQYPDYWCPLEDGCPGTPKKEVMSEIGIPEKLLGQQSGKKKIPHCIIAHNAAWSAVAASARMGMQAPQMAVDFLRAEASNLWGMT